MRDCNKHACNRKVSFWPFEFRVRLTSTRSLHIAIDCFLLLCSAVMAIVHRVIKSVEKYCRVASTSAHHAVIMANAIHVV